MTNKLDLLTGAKNYDKIQNFSGPSAKPEYKYQFANLRMGGGPSKAPGGGGVLGIASLD